MTSLPAKHLLVLASALVLVPSLFADRIDHDPSDYGVNCGSAPCVTVSNPLGTSGTNSIVKSSFNLAQLSAGTPGLAYDLNVIPNETLTLNLSGAPSNYGLLVQCASSSFCNTTCGTISGLACILPSQASSISLAAGLTTLQLTIGNFSGDVGVILSDPSGKTPQRTITSVTVAPTSQTPEPATFGLIGIGLLAVAAKFRRSDREISPFEKR